MSDEPQVGDAEYWSIIKLLTPESVPIVAAVLVEVARLEADGRHGDSRGLPVDVWIREAALAIYKALRLSKEGA